MTDIVPIEQIRSDLAKPPQSGTNVILGLVEQLEARDELITKITNYRLIDATQIVLLSKLDGIEATIVAAIELLVGTVTSVHAELLEMKALLNEKREAQQ